MTKCRIAACPKPVVQNGLCGMHRSRLQRRGSAEWQPPTVEQRLFAKVKAVGDCWVWTGTRVCGYAQISIDNRKHLVHRYLYEQMVADIPDGLTLDHLCLTPECVNPYHVEPVPNALNASRAAAIRKRHATAA